jgi:Na+/H+ antiporter NhaA
VALDLPCQAFDNPDTITNSKIAIIIASIIAATIGIIWLKLTLKKFVVNSTEK